MANFRLIGQDPAALGPQKLAAQADILQISGLAPSGGASPLTITPAADFTTNALDVQDGTGTSLLVLSSVPGSGTGTNTALQINDKTGTSLMSLNDAGALTLRGAAVVGSGTSSVAGPISFNGNVTFGNDAADTSTFARGWSQDGGSTTNYSNALSFVPSSGFGVTVPTGANAGVDLLVGTGATPDTASVVATAGSMMLHTGATGTAGTIWLKTGAAASAWSQIATGAGNSLQGAYDLSAAGSAPFITTSASKPVSIDSSAGGSSLTLDIGNSTGDILTAHSGIASAPVISLGGTASGYSLSPAQAAATASGAAVAITAGSAGATSGTGGALSLSAGASPTSGTGGAVTITSGNGTAAGAIGIQTGTGTTSAISIGTLNSASVVVGPSVLTIDSAGAFTATPTSGQAATITAAGAGTIDVTSATGNITVSSVASSGAAGSLVLGSLASSSASAGSVAVASYASGIGGSGNISIYTASGANPGGVVIATGNTPPAAPTSSNIELVANGEITFSTASGTVGPTYSEAGNRTLAGSFTATSIVGALNELTTSSIATTTLVIANGVTIAAGDVVALGTTAGIFGQAILGDASGTITPAVVGIALTGGIGDGTLTTTVLLAGKATTTITGASGGEAVYMEAAGALTLTAPSAPGAYLLRMGYAVSATELVIRMDAGTTI